MFKKVAELKKGDRVILAYGDQGGDMARCDSFDKLIGHIFHNSSYHPWQADVAANPRGKDPTVLMLHVPDVIDGQPNAFGDDIGDTYAHEIIGWMDKNSGTWQPIEHTKKQLDMRKLVADL